MLWFDDYFLTDIYFEMSEINFIPEKYVMWVHLGIKSLILYIHFYMYGKLQLEFIPGKVQMTIIAESDSGAYHIVCVYKHHYCVISSELYTLSTICEWDNADEHVGEQQPTIAVIGSLTCLQHSCLS